jgi:hypothetical protein
MLTDNSSTNKIEIDDGSLNQNNYITNNEYDIEKKKNEFKTQNLRNSSSENSSSNLLFNLILNYLKNNFYLFQ